MEGSDLKHLLALLEQRNKLLQEREREFYDQKEELQSQKEELTAAIEELVVKNNSLEETLQKLKQRNDELDKILYRTSHDLKTPVASIRGLVDLMKIEHLTESQQTIVTYIEQKALQMNDLLKSLTMLAQASFEDMRLSPVNPEQIIRQAIDDLRYLPNFPIVSVSTNTNNNSRIHTDAMGFFIIIKALLSNAMIFRDPARNGHVEIEIKKENGLCTVSVTDDGEGIPEEIGPNIFDMFFRGSTRSQGSGLGLYTTRTVVKGLKGQIRWTSKPGQTRFVVQLPD